LEFPIAVGLMKEKPFRKKSMAGTKIYLRRIAVSKVTWIQTLK
jgi:hypothetical protein